MSTLTTLIPAYKPDYLGELFVSLARQSFRDFQVIVSDDSPEQQITRLIRDGHFGDAARRLHLTVLRGPGNARRNHERLVDAWAGQSPLVHLLMDDDLLFPDFYKTHVAAHAAGRFAASVTPRWLSHADGRPAWTLPLPDFIENSPEHRVVVSPEHLFQSTLPSCSNWLGELSNIVLSADAARCFPRPPADGLNYYGLMDISALLTACQAQPLVFVRETQGVFRQHAEQTTRNTGSHGHRVAMLVWASMALHGWAEGRITSQQALQAVSLTVQRCLHLYGETDAVMNQFFALVQGATGGLPGLHASFTRFWLALLASHPATTPAAPVSGAAAAVPSAAPGPDRAANDSPVSTAAAA